MTETATLETETPAAVLPEKPFVATETPQEDVSHETAEKPPEIPEEKPPEISDKDAQIQLYQDVLAKHEKDSGYQMTDDEADAFLNVQELIAGGMKEPVPNKSESVSNETDKPDPKAEKPGEKAEVDLPGVSSNTLDSVRDAMQKVGAKDISELDGKIEGLINQMKSSGGKIGGELAKAKQREADHMRWLDDLSQGKPEAIQYLEKITGKSQDTTKAPDKVQVESDIDSDDFLDDKLAPIVLNLQKKMEEQTKVIESLKKGDSDRVAQASRAKASNGWVDDIVDLVVNNAKDFDLSASEARALGMEYWGPEGHTKAVHPKFQQVHELIQFAHEKGMPDLKTAHIVWQHENGSFAKKLIQATKEGQSSTQHKTSPNSFLSNKQGKMKTNELQPQIDDAKVAEMEKGDLDAIPDEWVDENGTLIPSKIPERFHEKAFGKMGKPNQ